MIFKIIIVCILLDSRTVFLFSITFSHYFFSFLLLSFVEISFQFRLLLFLLAVNFRSNSVEVSIWNCLLKWKSWLDLWLKTLSTAGNIKYIVWHTHKNNGMNEVLFFLFIFFILIEWWLLKLKKISNSTQCIVGKLMYMHSEMF